MKKKPKLRLWQMFMLLFLTASLLFIMILWQLCRTRDEQESLREAQALCTLYRYFLDDAQALMALVPNYVIGPHQRLARARVGCDHPGFPAPPMPAYAPRHSSAR